MILCGLGNVGRNVTRILQGRPGFRIVSAWTRNRELADRDVGELAGGRRLGVAATVDRRSALAIPAELVVVATTSFLREVASDIRASLDASANVICTAEEMAFPWGVDPELAQRLNSLARQRRVTVVGAGANPGFIYESLALTLTGAAWDVERMSVRRVVDVSDFSATVLHRLGIGYSEREFRRGIEEGTVYGHIGFPQTVQVLAAKFGVRMDRLEKSMEPILADRAYEIRNMRLAVGQTAGFTQQATAFGNAFGNDRPWFEAEFVGHVAPESAGLQTEDVFKIDGPASIAAAIRPGLNAQLTAAAVIANSIRRVVDAPPGLLSVADLPPAVPTVTRHEHSIG